MASLAALPPAALLAQATRLDPTPSCGRHEPTLRLTAGPYYKPASPERSDLRADVSRGEAMDISGAVIDTHCRPMSGAIVEIWHADDAGEYDNRGFRLRGWQRTNAEGRWGFKTIVPRFYAVRTAHYHFRIQPPDGPALVTQVFFPGQSRNAGDGLFDQRLLMRVSQGEGVRNGYFDFVLEAA